MNRLADQREREQALNPRESFAVIAPAGSGKTELLTRRVLTLLSQVEQPEHILAITFTRKAANEMRQRILRALQDAENQVPVNEHQAPLRHLAEQVLLRDKEHRWQLLKNPNRLRIQTIDSLCMTLAQRAPVTAGIGGEERISDTPLLLYQQAARNLLQRLSETGPVGSDLSTLLQHLDNNSARIERLFCEALAKREQWLRLVVGGRADLEAYKAYLEHSLELLVRETLMQAQAFLQSQQARLITCAVFARQHLPDTNSESTLLHLPEDATQRLEAQASDLKTWQAIAHLLLTSKGQWRQRLTKNEGFPADFPGVAKDQLKQAKQDCLNLIEDLGKHSQALAHLVAIRRLPSPHFAPEQWTLLGCLTRLLPLLVAELTLVFRAEGEMDYGQIAIAALQALHQEEEPSEVALALDYQLQHILVDEFQDTSSGQFALLAKLTEGWTPGDGKTLFIVGDGMQSCYGFRDANVGLFLAARKYGLGNAYPQALDLQVNFRSEPGLVRWVNATFAAAFPQENDLSRGAVRYAQSIPFSTAQERSCVHFIACVDDAEGTLEAEQVASIISSLRAQAPHESIALLVRSRTHLRSIIPRLQAAQIPWVGIDIEPIVERSVIQDCWALTRALLNPNDRIAWFALLRAPWCGLTLADLEVLGRWRGAKTALWCALEEPSCTEQLSIEGQARIKPLQALMERALSQRNRKSLRQSVEGLWLALGGAGTAKHPDDLQQVRRYFDLLEQEERGGSLLHLNQFYDKLKSLYSTPGANTAAVQVMTIHKAKGLEFDHVLVPGLARTSRSNTQPLMRWHERLSLQGAPQLLISPISAKGADDDPIYAWLKSEQEQKDALENTRLLYVACTRAVKSLTLIASLNLDEGSGSLRPPPATSLLHSIWTQVEPVARLVHQENAASDSLVQAIHPESFSAVTYPPDA